MKWIYRIVSVVILGVAIGLPFFMNNKDGKPMLSLPTADDLTPEMPDASSLTGGERVYYKWKDKFGQWHFGDEPPEGVAVVPVSVNVNANIIQSTPVEQPEIEPVFGPEGASSAKGAYQPPGSKEEVLTLDRALNIVNEAHAVKDMMNARNQALEGQMTE